MRNLLTLTGARWWFRSRNSGRLNLFSYWLCLLTLSAFIALTVDALYQTWLDRQAWHKQAAEYSDWIYAAPPDALKAYARRFEKKRDLLISGVTSRGDSTGTKNYPLVNAADAQAIMKNCKELGGMFGKSDTPVFPSCVTYAKRRGGLSKHETNVFNNFAAYVTRLYANSKGPEPNRIERELAGALGFSGNEVEEARRSDLTTLNAPPLPERESNSPDLPAAPERSKTVLNSPTFDVPWLYVASNEGAIAVFPGTTVIHGEGWDTTSRPWFRGSLRAETNLTTDGLFQNDRLSVTYLDVLAKSPMLVRTYMHTFDVEGEKFVVAVDLKLRNEEVSGVTPRFFERKPDFPRFFLRALWPSQLHSAHYVAFALSLFFFLLIRRATADRKLRYTFWRIWSEYGKVKTDDAFKLQKEEQFTKERKLGIGLQKHVRWQSERAETESYGVVSSTTAESTGGTLRGLEFWDISLSTDIRWKLLWVRFESVKSTYVGTVNLAYTDEVLPDAKWARFNSRDFSRQEEAELYSSLLTIIEHNADLSPPRRDVAPSADYFDIPAPLNEVSRFLNPPKLPDWLPAVVDPKELLAARQCRAYVRLSSTQIEELYSNSRVEAVMTSGYFEQLLNKGQVDFLLHGSNIDRLISFPKPDATLNLTEAGRAKLKELQTTYAYTPKNTRTLRRVNTPITGERARPPVHDFVILDRESVIVAHSISAATEFDQASGKQTKSTHYVEGYVSWRPSDVAFHRKHFEELKDMASNDLDVHPTGAEAESY